MNKSIGVALREQRELAGLSQSALSKKTGIPQQTISAWESDTNLPSIDACIKLADFYSVALDELIGRELPKNF